MNIKISLLKLISHILIALVALALTTQANAAKQSTHETLESLIENPKAWENFSWPKSGESNVIRDLRWIENKERSVESNGTTVSHHRQVRIQDSIWNASRRQIAKSNEDVIISISRELPTEDCSDAARKMGRGLGEPIENDDSSRIYFSEENFSSIIIRRWQWLIGGTTIDAGCFGTDGISEKGKKQLILNVLYQSSKLSPPLSKNFLLRCSRTLKIGVAGNEKSIDDMAFWVSPNQPYSIRTPKFEPMGLGEKILINETLIKFTVQTKVGKVRYSIDRVTGTLGAEILDDARYIGSISGKCEKSASSTLF